MITFVHVLILGVSVTTLILMLLLLAGFAIPEFVLLTLMFAGLFLSSFLFLKDNLIELYIWLMEERD